MPVVTILVSMTDVILKQTDMIKSKGSIVADVDIVPSVAVLCSRGIDVVSAYTCIYRS